MFFRTQLKADNVMKTNIKNNNNDDNTSNNNNNNIDSKINSNPKNPKVVKVVFDNRIKRKNVLALNEKVAAIREYEKRPIYKRIGRMFHCSPDQIKRIVQQKDAILSAWEQRTRKRDAKTLEMKVVRVSMLGKAVYEWIRRMMYYKDILITDGLIQKMALQFKSAMGLQNFFPHQDWCDKFRQIYHVTETDSKLLNIGYTTGHSVQIKDVIKDVLSECSPEDEKLKEEERDDRREHEFNENVDGLKRAENNSRNQQATITTQALPLPQLQGLRQLVALPIQTNGLSGTGQKVLVATPITTAGQRTGATPMTMTIIPLATIAQSNQSVTSNLTSQNNLPRGAASSNADIPQITVPPPMTEIKKEIKEEPKDADNDEDDDFLMADTIQIKKEYQSDDSNEEQMPEALNINGSTKPLNTENNAGSEAKNQSRNVDKLTVDEESTNDSLEDVALAKLQKRIKDENTTVQVEQEQGIQTESLRGSNSPQAIPIQTSPIPVATQPTLRPMPPLTKAPNLSLNTSHLNRTTTNRRLRSQEDYVSLPAIRTCSEARTYLKLLEDFALERESFRLIGLITRADEVLRELDRKDHGSDEDDDDIE
uniref:HTH CENPB-type domain-containing protein n=1 Tax=Glossina brevipalpis TaxID=37001 RepID=A0A1A9VZE4_9MUSC